MKKSLTALVALFLLSSIGQAAPYYTGIGCNEEGTSCIAGKPSKRVLQWSRKGTVDELGSRCEKFFENLEQRQRVIGSQRAIDLKYKNFTFSWVAGDLDQNGHAKIRCSIELHSEIADVKIVGEKVKSLYWVCENENSGGICKNYESDCETLRQQTLKDPTVLDATIYRGASLMQGNICDVVAARFK